MKQYRRVLIDNQTNSPSFHPITLPSPHSVELSGHSTACCYFDRIAMQFDGPCNEEKCAILNQCFIGFNSAKWSIAWLLLGLFLEIFLNVKTNGSGGLVDSHRQTSTMHLQKSPNKMPVVSRQ